MGKDNIIVSLNPIVTTDKNGAKNYKYIKFNDKNNNGIFDKGDIPIGSLTLEDKDKDGLDSHDAVVSKHFGEVSGSLLDSMTKSAGGYNDVSVEPVNPVSKKAYSNIDGKINSNGIFEITSGETQESNLGSLVNNVRVASQTKAQADAAKSGTQTGAAGTAGAAGAAGTAGITGATGTGVAGLAALGALTAGDGSIPMTTLHPDYNKVQAAYYGGLAELQSSIGMGLYGMDNPVATAQAMIDFPQRALAVRNRIYEALGGTLTTGTGAGAAAGTGTGAGNGTGAGAAGAGAGLTSTLAAGAAGLTTDPNADANAKAKADADAKAKADAEAKAKAKAEEDAKTKKDGDAKDDEKTITIKKNKGITSGLQDYITTNKLGTKQITKTQWQAAIAELKRIQAERAKDKETGIYNEVSTGDKYWHKHMVVNEGTISFTDAEMKQILNALGITEVEVTK